MEGLDLLENIRKFISDKYIQNNVTKEEVKEQIENIVAIGRELEKNEDELKAFKILKKYKVDIWLLKRCNYEDYIRIRKEAGIKVAILPKKHFYFLNGVIK